MKLYDSEKERTRTLLTNNPSRIAITTDMWTSSNQNRGYMAVTAHYIDDYWNLQSRIMRFIYVPAPHTAKVLSDVLIQCLMDWNLDRKLSTLTVDNCTTNDAMIEHILEKISPRSFILGGLLFHIRCCAHILNLIVKDGLSIISDAIEKVRESVSFWTATPKREEKFKDTCDQLNIAYVKKLTLDCKTRWNSTFLMLHVAIRYKDVFGRLARRENQYKSLPSDDDWDMANEICKRLQLFYSVTELFSGTKYPTSNVYFPKIYQIRLALREWLGSPNFIIHQMASTMIGKFEKYWNVINGVMAVGTVLDPRYKMMMLVYFFPKIYGEDSNSEIEKVKAICEDLIIEYHSKSKGKETTSSSSRPNVVGNMGVADIEISEEWSSGFDLFVSQQNSTNVSARTELDHYLEEPVLPRSSGEFDILNWWKTNGLKYPTLQLIARDFLAIPISTVASESAFSTSGRFLTPHRSSSNSKVDVDRLSSVFLEDIDDDAEPSGGSSSIVN